MAGKKNTKDNQEETKKTEKVETSKYTYQDLLEQSDAVDKLMEIEGLSIDTDVKLSIYKKELRKKTDTFNEVQKENVEKYAEKDDNGNPIFNTNEKTGKPIPGNYKIEDPVSLQEAQEALIKQEVDFAIPVKFTKKEFDVEKVKGRHLMPLLDAITDKHKSK